MIGRYTNRQIIENASPGYQDPLQRRGLTSIKQYGRVRMPAPSPDERRALSQYMHPYATGDKLYKIAHKHYGDAGYWWILAWWNQKPTDFHCSIGDTIYVPLPLKEVLYLVNRRD